MKKILIALSALMLVHTASVRAISGGDIISKAGDLVSIVPSLIGNGQSIVEGSQTLPGIVGVQFGIAQKMQKASKAASSEEGKRELLLGATYHIYDATEELAKFVASCGGFVKDLGSLAGVFGSGNIVNTAKNFGSNIKQPVENLITTFEQMREQLIVMGGDPDATLSKADAAKAQAKRDQEKTTLAATHGVAQAAAKPVNLKMTASDYGKAALQMLPVIVTLVGQSITLVNNSKDLPKNINNKLARLKIKEANLNKAKKIGTEDQVKEISLSINLDLLDVATMLGQFCSNAGEVIESFGSLAKIVKQTTMAGKARTLGTKIKAQGTVLAALVNAVKAEMKTLGADSEFGMKEVVAAMPAAPEVALPEAQSEGQPGDQIEGQPGDQIEGEPA